MKSKKIIEFLVSRKFALISLGALIILSVTAMLIPQNTPVNEEAYKIWSSTNPELAQFFGQIGLTKLFSSPLFFLISFFLFVSILFCTFKQIRFIKKLIRLIPTVNHPATPPLNLGMLSNDSEIKRISSILRRNGYLSANFNRYENMFRATKYTIGYWGSVILHLGFIIIIVGALVSGLTKMQGYIYLGEGQTITEDQESYWQLTKAPLFPGHRGFALRLDRLQISYPQTGLPYTDSLQMTVLDREEQFTRTLPSNENLNYRGVKFFPDLRGYAVALVFTDENNQIMYNGFFHLRTFWHETKENYHLLTTIPELALEMDIKFYPDYEINKGIMSTKTWKPVKPAMNLTVKREGQVLYRGPLKLEEKVKVGDYWLSFPEYRNNQVFKVISDRGTPILFTGFLITSLGLLLLYFFNPRQVWLKIEDLPTGRYLLLWAKAQKFPLSFEDDVKFLVQQLEAALIVKEQTDHGEN